MALERGGFAVVVVDPRLPDGDGPELVRELKERAPERRVLVLTIVGQS